MILQNLQRQSWNLQMDTKTAFVGAWFGATISTLIFAILLFIYLSQPKIILLSNQNFKLYAALPEDSVTQTQYITPSDARAKIIENFFKKYSSPLFTYSKNFVAVSDAYKLDWRLLPAISMQESNGGKKVIKNSYNPFGYGIYGYLIVKFSSWEEAIEKVGKALKNEYVDIGLKTPKQIMTKYTPSSLSKGGVWAKGVASFMEELR